MNTLELQVADEPFLLYRCSECDSTHWTRDDEVVPFEAVTQMLRDETRAKAERREQLRRARVR